MKIGIVTLPLHTNYGGILQAYALQTVLERMGHQVEHLQPQIEFPKLHPAWKMPFVFLKRTYLKFFAEGLQYPVFTHPYKYVRKNTDDFIKKYLICRYIGQNEWERLQYNDYDAIIFGSDQVWRLEYAVPIERYFGAFIGDLELRRISYAASFGVDSLNYSKSQLRQCFELLNKFNAVSVREQAGVNICKDSFNVCARLVLDPTMLLKVTDYELLTQEVKADKNGVLTYVLDESDELNAKLHSYAQKRGLNLFRINSKVEDSEAKLVERQQPRVEQWLRDLMEADMIITDSFHACVFSIIFHKPFICIGNIQRGASRFKTLLERFNLCNRIVHPDSLMTYIDCGIDWEEVDRQLCIYRQESLSFIMRALQ